MFLRNNFLRINFLKISILKVLQQYRNGITILLSTILSKGQAITDIVPGIFIT